MSDCSGLFRTCEFASIQNTPDISLHRVVRIHGTTGFCRAKPLAADPARLGGAAAAWGSYYDNDPPVMVLDLRKSMDVPSALPLPSALLNSTLGADSNPFWPKRRTLLHGRRAF
ncbi:MAG: thermostable hemolysin [Gammaproteobacteria bacterium]